MNCVSLGSGTHVYAPACKHTHADITQSDKYDIHVSETRQKKNPFSSLHQRVHLLPGEQALNKMLESQPEFKMKCFKMHSKQQLQARAGPDSLLMLA